MLQFLRERLRFLKGAHSMSAVSIHDIAAYIIEQQGPISTMKLQKLCYYAQGWHLAWDEEPLFPEDFQAWAMGPVAYDMFKKHQGKFEMDSWPWGNASKLTDSQKETVDAVLEAYGSYSGLDLGSNTHLEPPWIEARGDCEPGERCSNIITKESMQDFFGGLLQTDE